MKKLFHIAKAEFLSIFSDGGAMLVLFGAMLIYGTLYPLIYAPQVVRELPVAVVDLDDTPASRKLARMLDATTQATVRYMPTSLDQARDIFMERKIHGVMLIPHGYEACATSGRQSTVSLYADGSYFLMYSNFLEAVAAVTSTAGAEFQQATLLGMGLSPEQAEVLSQPVEYKVENLYNPYNGYATALLPPVLLLIIQQLILIGIGIVGGTWYERHKWRSYVGYSPLSMVFAKAGAYMVLYIPLTLYVFSFQYKLFNYPILGSHIDLLLVLLPYLLSCIFMGLTIGALVRHRESSLMLLVCSSVFFLMLSGISWPAEGMPQWLYALGKMIPSSNGIEALVRIRTMGPTIQDVAGEVIILWILTGVYATTAVLATTRRLHQAAEHPEHTTECDSVHCVSKQVD